MSVFGAQYAAAYDALYHDKDFASEASAVSTLIRDLIGAKAKSVIDFGCGTGTHATLLSNDFNVVGVDLSREMLEIARTKSKSIDFYLGDIRTVELHKRADVATMMFAVLGYQTRNEDVIDTLRNIHRHLLPGGLLIFDVWYGPGVLLNKPSARVKKAMNGDTQIIRYISPTLFAEGNVCQCDYHLLMFKNSTLVANVEETHSMRYFFPAEMIMFLKSAGFELINYTRAGFPYRQISDYDWSIMFTCRKI